MGDTPTPDFLAGIAMTLAQLCRMDGADLARRLADQWELAYGDFVGARVDEADLEELRRVFDVAPAAADISSR
jgi:hypothetical protein